ncbi:MAG: arylsulfatase [Planctomycetota bacterium]
MVLLGPVVAAAERPNIVVVFCDDLGYGDVGCLNPENGRIVTVAADRLAAEGMVFTDAHAGSSVCTPTRYGLLTGRYSWRTRLQRGVVQGFAPNLVAPDRPTVAGVLRELGYRTAIVGKWHLNFQYRHPDTGELMSKQDVKATTPPVGATVPDGPLTRGFDTFHGFHHARSMRAVIEDDRVIEHDETINMLPRLTREAVAYIDESGADDDGRPFFLYVPLGSPHTPIVPTPEWQGRSGLGGYADFVMQTDAALGAILDALDRHGFADDTLVIFSSDNGTSRAAGIPELRAQGHWVSAGYRGSKADLWDGGHRIPFIVRWPGHIEPGTTSDELICLTDLFATVCEIAGEPIPAGSGEDSVSFLPALRGETIASTRAGVVHHSTSGHFGYRQGPWKLLLARGSGGWTSPKESEVRPGSPEAQLYQLDDDPGETTNLYHARPEVARRLLNQLIADVERGRSTDGPDALNDVADIVLWKSGRD